jgi:hypothetical protein
MDAARQEARGRRFDGCNLSRHLWGLVCGRQYGRARGPGHDSRIALRHSVAVQWGPLTGCGTRNATERVKMLSVPLPNLT